MKETFLRNPDVLAKCFNWCRYFCDPRTTSVHAALFTRTILGMSGSKECLGHNFLETYLRDRRLETKARSRFLRLFQIPKGIAKRNADFSMQ